jgi:hypothetical protein
MTNSEAHFSGVPSEGSRVPWKETALGFVIRISFGIESLAVAERNRCSVVWYLRVIH